jgi:hypothetical protein
MTGKASWATVAVFLWLLWPAGAQAAVTRPGVATGAAASVLQSTATLTGVVNPHGAATTYVFQYGPTSLYGAQTTPASAGAGTRNVRVAVPIGNLAPFTIYHYRLVASNAKGLTKGGDRTLRTLRQPLGVTLTALPNPVRFGRSITLAGSLTGTGNANREVLLQANPAPYTTGFVNVGNIQVTNAQGGFSFTLPALGLNAQFRVLMPAKPTVVSPIVAVGVRPTLSMHVSRRGTRLRFSGSVRPAMANTVIFIQKRRHHHWRTIARAITRHASDTRSSYRRHVRQRRGGRYRAVVAASVTYTQGTSRSRVVHVR